MISWIVLCLMFIWVLSHFADKTYFVEWSSDIGRNISTVFNRTSIPLLSSIWRLFQYHVLTQIGIILAILNSFTSGLLEDDIIDVTDEPIENIDESFDIKKLTLLMQNLQSDDGTEEIPVTKTVIESTVQLEQPSKISSTDP